MSFKQLRPRDKTTYSGVHYNGRYIALARDIADTARNYTYAKVSIDDNEKVFKIEFTNEQDRNNFTITDIGMTQKISVSCNMPKGRYLQDESDSTLFRLSEEAN